MKTLCLIGGAMGIGKSSTARALMQRLSRCAMLDGDWCWTMQPFTVNDETRAMVMDNITHTLANFLRCSELESVVFCWVMHQQQIIEDVLSRLPLDGVRVVCVSLVCTSDALAARLHTDIAAGLRDHGCLERALAYLPLYDALQTYKLDVTHLSPAEAAKRITNIEDTI
ncbi:MAG: AAA family ATPase [Clostridia bacterium]|nr:AAA family ATPase [Clostridia bacterium]